MTPVERLAQINGTGDGGSSFAVNLAGGDDFEDQIFLDLTKRARGWLNGTDFNAVPAVNLNSEGALASLPAGQTSVKYFFSAFRDGNGVYLGTPLSRSGRFRLTFTGSATIGGSGITNLTQIDANTYEFDCDMIGNKWVNFTPTAFPIKATIVRTTDIAAHAAGNYFRQNYLDSLPSGGCFRFVLWSRANSSTIVNWSDVPTPAAQRYVPVPYEVMTQLCTIKNADAWFCIPPAASDAYVTSMATYLRDNFPSGRRIRIELSNEIWNTSTFSATGLHFKGLAESVWGVADGYANSLWLHYAGKRFAQIMQIFNSVFAGQTNRLIGVIAAQAAGSGSAIAMADAVEWWAREPGSYVAPRTLARELSIAPYINWAGIGATAHGNNIKAQLDISQAAAVAYIKGMVPASQTQAQNWITTYTGVAASRNLRLTMYEYNQHYSLAECSGSTLYSGGVPVPGAEAAFYEATYSQEIADAQDDLRTYFRNQNGSLMAFYQDIGRATQFGTWGARTDLDHASPIWNDLLTWHGANTRWWAQ